MTNHRRIHAFICLNHMKSFCAAYPERFTRGSKKQCILINQDHRGLLTNLYSSFSSLLDHRWVYATQTNCSNAIPLARLFIWQLLLGCHFHSSGSSFQHPAAMRLHINLNKSILSKSQIVSLGYSYEVIRPLSRNIETIEHFPKPEMLAALY